VEKVSSGEGDAHFVEFYQRAARLLYHRVLLLFCSFKLSDDVPSCRM